MQAQPGKRRLTDLQLLLLLAAVRLIIHLLTNNQYGFHRDALAFLDNGQHLAWGYIAYPPLTPFIGRIGLELFGLSLVGIKSLAALAQCAGMVLTGLMVKELGGGRWAQVVAAIAATISIMSLMMSTLFQYISFDYLWWVLTIYFFIRLLKTNNPRWWLGVGCGFGLGMMTKYTMLYLVAAIVITVLFTQLRSHLKSPWLWAGVGLSLLIFLPNLIWQIQHQFASIEFLTAIRARDIQIGRADGFFSQQLYVNLNPLTLPLFLSGIYYFFFTSSGSRYRAVGWLFILVLVLFGLSRGRFYYAAPVYPMILAGGAVLAEQWLTNQLSQQQRLANQLLGGLLIVGAIVGVVLALPVAPINSAIWDVTSDVHDNFVEQVGWEEMTQKVAAIYNAEVEKRPSLGIIAGNYGEAGALNLYGPSYGLPTAISPVNSYWNRGFGENPPEAAIALGFTKSALETYFGGCTVVGKNDNAFGVFNEESRFSPDIYLCEDLREPWEQIWPKIRSFG